jgi:hypothetical protein
MYQTNVERWFFCLIENKDVLRHVRLCNPHQNLTTQQVKKSKVKKKKKQIKKLRSLSEEIINACDLQTISSWKKLESLKDKHTALIWNHRKKKTVQQLYLKGLRARNMTVQRLIQERNNLSSLLSNQYCSIYIFYSYSWWIEKVHTRILNVNFIMGELGGHQRDLIKAKRNS